MEFQICGWMDGWTDGQMDGWMDGWVGGWIHQSSVRKLFLHIGHNTDKTRSWILLPFKEGKDDILLTSLLFS